jgi:WD40 repeat protein
MTPWLCPKCLLDRVAEGEPSLGAATVEPDGAAAPSEGVVEETLPRPLGNYELLERIGQGGMGIVYQARQVSLDRVVAVKVLGALSSKEYVHRFRTEAVAAGSLQHPNIVAIHEVGLWEGQHYLVMDYVAGPTFAELTRDGPLPAARAAGYLRVIAEGIHFAHERGILHRDLKPSNVLLDAHDQPRVTDFGLAKRLESGLDLTLSGQVLGSPSYMPPEQASGRREQVGRRSDVYSLGAILFHLLTGRPPFVSETLPDTLRQVLDEEPLSPHLLNPAVPVDLETICLKCLEKDPDRRYATAQALADELGRFLRDEPILARPVGLTGKVWRWCRRNPPLAGLGAVVLALLVVVAIGSPLAVHRINQQRLAAVEQTKLAELRGYAAHINSAQQYLKAGNLGRTRELLALATDHSPATPNPRGWEWAYLRSLCRGDYEYVLEQLPAVSKLTISPDGRFLALALRYGQVHVWDLSARRLLDVVGEEHDSPTLTAFSPDSRRVAFLTRGEPRIRRGIGFWNISTRAVESELPTTNLVGGAFFVPGRPELIECGIVGPERERRFALWDLTTQRIKAVARLGTRGGQLYAGNELRFTPDGNRLLHGDLDGKVKVYDTRNLESLGAIPVHDTGVSALALSPDGRILATAQVDRGTAIHLWDFEATLDAARSGQAPQPLALLLGHDAWVTSLSFSPDGHLLASASVDHSIRIWELPSRKQTRRLHGHENEVYGIQFAPDGRLYSVGRDGLVCAWSLATPPRAIGPARRNLALSDMDMSPSGRRLAGVRNTGEIGFFELGAGDRFDALPDLGTDNLSVGQAAAGRLLCAAQRSGEIVLYDAEQQRVLCRLPGTVPLSFCKTSRDAKLVVAVDAANQVTVWQTPTSRPQASWAVDGIYSCGLSPDASLFATGHERGRIELWDPWTGQRLRSLTHLKERTTALAFSPDGRFLAAASWAGPVTVWEGPMFRKTPVLSGHPHSTLALAFSPDGRRLATGSRDREAVKLWDTATWQELLTLDAPGDSLGELAFTADGTRLVGRTDSGDVLIWHAPGPEDARVPMEIARAQGPRPPQP